VEVTSISAHEFCFDCKDGVPAQIGKLPGNDRSNPDRKNFLKMAVPTRTGKLAGNIAENENLSKQKP